MSEQNPSEKSAASDPHVAQAWAQAPDKFENYIAEKLKSYAEQNIASALEFVQRLGEAQTFQDVIQISDRIHADAVAVVRRTGKTVQRDLHQGRRGRADHAVSHAVLNCRIGPELTRRVTGRRAATPTLSGVCICLIAAWFG